MNNSKPTPLQARYQDRRQAVNQAVYPIQITLLRASEPIDAIPSELRDTKDNPGFHDNLLEAQEKISEVQRIRRELEDLKFKYFGLRPIV